MYKGRCFYRTAQSKVCRREKLEITLGRQVSLQNSLRIHAWLLPLYRMKVFHDINYILCPIAPSCISTLAMLFPYLLWTVCSQTLPLLAHLSGKLSVHITGLNPTHVRPWIQCPACLLLPTSSFSSSSPSFSFSSSFFLGRLTQFDQLLIFKIIYKQTLLHLVRLWRGETMAWFGKGADTNFSFWNELY